MRGRGVGGKRGRDAQRMHFSPYFLFDSYRFAMFVRWPEIGGWIQITICQAHPGWIFILLCYYRVI